MRLIKQSPTEDCTNQIKRIIASLESQIEHSRKIMIKTLSDTLEDEEGCSTLTKLSYLQSTLDMIVAHAELVEFLRKRDTRKDGSYMTAIQAISFLYVQDIYNDQ